jgi:Flp pilus assembly protein TadG
LARWCQLSCSDIGMKLHFHRQKGAAAVELGLLLVPLVTLVFGVTEYGRAMYQYNTLAKAVRTGARYLSAYQAGNATAIQAGRNLVLCGHTDCANEQPLVPSLTLDKVTVADAANDSNMKAQPFAANGVTVGITNLVRVTVTGFQFVSAASFVVPPFTFDPISVTMTQALP